MPVWDGDAQRDFADEFDDTPAVPAYFTVCTVTTVTPNGAPDAPGGPLNRPLVTIALPDGSSTQSDYDVNYSATSGDVVLVAVVNRLPHILCRLSGFPPA